MKRTLAVFALCCALQFGCGPASPRPTDTVSADTTTVAETTNRECGPKSHRCNADTKAGGKVHSMRQQRARQQRQMLATSLKPETGSGSRF